MNLKHGMVNTPTYKSWEMMIQRCTNPKYSDYKNYGARGITIDPSWRTFTNFLADMGIRPEYTTLDRINNDGNYELSNCCWNDWDSQQNNRRHTIRLTYNNVTATLKEWGELTGISHRTLRGRYQAKWSVERILTTPAYDTLNGIFTQSKIPTSLIS